LPSRSRGRSVPRVFSPSACDISRASNAQDSRILRFSSGVSRKSLSTSVGAAKHSAGRSRRYRRQTFRLDRSYRLYSLGQYAPDQYHPDRRGVLGGLTSKRAWSPDAAAGCPGLLPFEDIAVQRADLPPISSKHTEPWAPGLLRTVGAAWIVVDLADPACAKRVLVIGTELAQRKIKQSDRWSGVDSRAYRRAMAKADTGVHSASILICVYHVKARRRRSRYPEAPRNSRAAACLTHPALF
jgi:hypothetical protein